MFLSKYTRLWFGVMFLCLTVLSSCKKNEVEQQEGAHIRIINASPAYATYNVYIDGTKVNNSGALPFGGTVSFMRYETGTHEIKFTSASNTTTLLSKSLSTENARVYSVYLVNTGDKLETLIINDEATQTSTTQAFVKFVNVSPDAPALDLYVKDGASLFKGITYKNGSAYALIDAKTQTLEIKDAATGTVKATLTDTEFTAGRYYTIIAKGMLNPGPDDRAFDGQSIVHQ